MKVYKYITGFLIIILLLTGCVSSGSTYQSSYTSPVNTKINNSSSDVTNSNLVIPDVPTNDTNLSNDNYYTNVDGNKVHSPAYSPSRPSGASARCRDGTYSFSQHRRGTCSHHGGVATWY